MKDIVGDDRVGLTGTGSEIDNLKRWPAASDRCTDTISIRPRVDVAAKFNA